jgi:membrane protein implicated in regulation of membrane protease activity
MPADEKEAGRNARRSTVTFIAGLLLLSISFATFWVLGLVGFLVMLVSAVVLVQSVRRLARERWGHPLGGEEEGNGKEPLSGREPWGRGQEGGRWWSGRGGRGPGQDDDGFGDR